MPQAAPRACWEQLTCSGASVIVGALPMEREKVFAPRLGPCKDAISAITRQPSVGGAGYKTHSRGV